MSINKVLITGNLTRDPELRAAASGTPVLSLGIAVNDRRKNNQTGQWEDYPNFFDCTMFGTRAESVSRYLFKGSKVTIEGKLHWSQWESDGQKRSKVSVIVDNIEFMSARQEQPVQQTYQQPAAVVQPVQQQAVQPAQPTYQAQQPAQPTYQPIQSQIPVQQPVVEPSIYDGDVPF